MSQALSYEQARKLIQDGDILFFPKGETTLYGYLIRFFTRSKFVHVGIAFWANICGLQRLMIVEAHGSGMTRRIVNASFYKKCELEVLTPLKLWKDYYTEALGHVATTRYSFLEAMFVGFREGMLKYLNINIPTRNLSSGEICSEFVAKMQGIKPYTISPQALYEELQKQGSVVRIFTP